MALELDPLPVASLVRIATGLLLTFMAVPLWRRPSPRARPLALFVASFGTSAGLGNVRFASQPANTTLLLATIALNLVAVAALTWLFRREGSPGPSRWRTFAVGLVCAAVATGFYLSAAPELYLTVLGQTLQGFQLWVAFAADGTFVSVVVLMGAYVWLAGRRARQAAAPDVRALATLSIGFGVYTAAWLSMGNTLAMLLVGSLIALAPLLLGIVAWSQAKAGPLSSWTPAWIVGAGLLAGVGEALPRDMGILGIVRVISVAAIGFGIYRWHAFGPTARPSHERRGALATMFLVVLLIVAQVAQNFFSAKYGLIMGGVLAGGFVFAASPIQRAIERSSDRPKTNTAAPGSAAAGYKAALRAAMRDGTLTRREERHLAEVAMALGISPVQALDLRDEVEREDV